MIRCVAEEGRQRRVEQALPPRQIDEGSVAAHERGSRTSTSPSETTVKQWQVLDLQVLDQQVENISRASVEIVVTSLVGAASNVEVSHYQPRHAAGDRE